MIQAALAKFFALTVRTPPAAAAGKLEGDEGQPATEGSQVQQHLSRRSIACMTFRNKALRRGLHAVNVLTGFGSLLASSHGSEDTYGMSTPVDSLDVFISHSWSMGRLPKFLALSLHFNLGNATVVGLTMSCITAALGFLGFLPKYKCASSDAGICHAPICVVVFYICFMTVLLCGHDIVRRCGRFRTMSRLAFLDKACIHQTDKELQKEGICSLSAFLTCSKELLVVYTDLYLKRLWTVYELASTLILRPDTRITVVPVDLVRLVYAGSVLMFVVNIAEALVLGDAVRHMVDGFVVLQACSGFVYIFCLVFGLPLIIFLRRWARQCSQMYATARSFSIRNAACAFEEDRGLVHANIASLMRDLDFVPQDAHDDVALDAFDLLARELMPLHLRGCLGSAGIPYSHAMTVLMTTVAYGLDVGVAQDWHLLPPWNIMMCCLNWGNILFATLPLWIALCSSVCAKQQHLKGICEVLFCLCSWVLVLAATVFFTMSFEKLYRAAKETWLAFAVYFLMTVSLNLAAYFVYNRQSVPAEAYAATKQRCKELGMRSPLPPEVPAAGSEKAEGKLMRL